jgi:hypothetical protein
MADPVLTPTYREAPAVTGVGDVLFISADGGTTFVQIQDTSKIQYNGRQINKISTNSTTNVSGYETSIPGMKDPGTLDFSMIFDPAGEPGQLLLVSSFDANLTLLVRHVYHAPVGFTSGRINAFKAWVQKCPVPGSDESDKTTMDVSLQITGPITVTDAVPEGD